MGQKSKIMFSEMGFSGSSPKLFSERPGINNFSSLEQRQILNLPDCNQDHFQL